jgi:hypothetical protein
MPALKNIRHEQFARELIEAQRHGRSQAEAYQRAGYKAHHGSAEANAARLLGNAKAGVTQRVQELMQNGARKAAVTAESLITQLEATIAGATEAKQFGAVNGSLALMGKLTGLLREKIEISSGGGPFDACQSVEDCVRLMLQDETPGEALALIDMLRAEIERQAGDHAQVIQVAVPARPVPGGEAERSLQYLRPKRRRR